MRELTCPACQDTGERELPVEDYLAPYPCPCCHPWGQGFPGERSLGRWVIEPAEPGAPAMWVGWP
jgi:hypothetical protein